LNTVDQALDYLDYSDHPNLLLHLDTFHLAIEEAEPVAAVQAALPKIGYFELNQSHRGRLDQGSLDLAAMSDPLEKAGYSGWIGVEAFARSRMADDHANALAIWRDQFNDANGLARNALEIIHKIFDQRAHM
jgi:D-psicose/D-tagatose/L-ribulose 3-epimerase